MVSYNHGCQLNDMNANNNNNKRGNKPRSNPAPRRNNKGVQKKKVVVAPRSLVIQNFRHTKMEMAACTAKYALAIADPFNPNADGLCLPTLPSIRSQKVARFVRGTFTVGTNGCGFVAMAPSINNDYGCIYTTDATYASTGATSRGTATVLASGVTCDPMPGPWASTNCLPTTSTTNGVPGRMVVAGLTAQYVGTQLNMGGVMYGLTQPDHEPLLNSAILTSATLGAYKNTYVAPNCGQKVRITANAISSVEEEYSTRSVVDSGGVISAAASQYCFGDLSTGVFTAGSQVYADPNMLIAVYGGVAGTSYLYEAIIHCEYTGRPTAAVATLGEADIVGY